jgi:OOP family OmpA-OmpF porin
VARFDFSLMCLRYSGTLHRPASYWATDIEELRLMKKKWFLACACVLPAFALADEVGHWYVTPSFGGVSVDNDRPVEDKDWLYGFAIGKHLTPAWSAELNVNGAQVGGGPLRSDLSLYGNSLDLLRVFNRDGVFSPYIGIGAGVLENDFSPGSNATDFMAQAGLGAFVQLWENSSGSTTLSLRPDLKARWDDTGAQGYLHDFIATLGFQLSFGAGRAPPPAPTEPPPPPPPPPAQTAPAPPPPPVAAAADSDKDGVIDDNDACPGTPPGVAVDARGCPQKGSITLEGVTFDVNSANLTGPSLPVLTEIAEGLKKYPRLKVELQGHTDNSGADAYNLTLSQKRANAVREYLLQQGVPSSQLTARGYGESQPIDSNTTAEGRAKNRRVVMFVLENPGDVQVQGEGQVQP